MADSTKAALVISAYDRSDTWEQSLEQSILAGLSIGHEVELVNLLDLGWVTEMSPAERRAYHTENPAIDPMVIDQISKVKAADTLVLGFPTRNWLPIPIMKGWFDRVMIPGVAFTFDENRKLQPNLDLETIGGVTTYDMSRVEVRRIIDGGRRIILRSLRANIPKRPRRVWLSLYNAQQSKPEQRSAFLSRVETQLATL